MERFCAVLIEHTSGHFPLWLTPDQVAILPLSEKYNDYAKEVAKKFDLGGVRPTIDLRNEKLGRKIRDNELKRIPYMVIVGEKEQQDGTVAVRPQGGGEQKVMTIQEFIDHINAKVKEMTKDF
jgi:threonyl-tRNA synthetase